MEPTNKTEILNNFIAVTQCSNEEATRYLEAAQWNTQTAMEIFYDDGGSHTSRPTASTNTNINQGASGEIASGGTGGYESDDEAPIQNAIDESLRASATKSTSAVSKDDKSKSSSASSSKFGTIGSLHKEGESSDEEGQAFYAGGSERSGQQILGPPKPKDMDKKVTKIFEAARKQGAIEADDDEHGSSSQTKKEKPFTGVGYTLGDETTPSRSLGQSRFDATAPAASNQAEQIPLRFFSNGFTVGDGELRKFEDNKEFMSYIKRGEVPPELRNLTTGGRQIEVRLEDHREEEYKPVAPQFKPFGGAGYMLGSPAPTVVSPSKTTRDSPFQSSMTTTTSRTSAPTDSSDLEKLAEQQLKSSSSSTTIRLRLPDVSTPIRIVIDLNRTLADVRKFLNENVPSLQSNLFQFIEPPSTKIKHEDESKTISEAKLTNATLAIRRGS
ncbi:unnamed protein product [Rotaria sp. Silwood1]|nr:unnamed protein product [Rotaria sp. Silwood1]CAF4520705.1 unnamed protein product [Rotaria sp. Silwood1]CAF4725741.1 unnamed protein product [Rotaria sp. Silwood1]